MKTTIIGLDLAKNIFHTVELGAHDKPSKRKRYTRTRLKVAFSNRQSAIIAMEACAGAQYWARLFQSQGHQVAMLPAQHVKAYARGQKNDYNDAQAIAEACLHNRVRSVPVKSVQQQDQQAIFRMRTLTVETRAQLVNQLRGLLAEYGLVIGQGISRLRKAIPLILEDADNGLSDLMRQLLQQRYQHLLTLDEQLEWFNQQIHRQAAQDSVCQRLQTIPGFGPIVSSVMLAWIGDGRQFRHGRDASAALGVVPRQHTSGDKQQLYGITKKGNKYLRALVIHGARSVVKHAANKQDSLNRWIMRLVESRGKNRATVALANKLIRIAWVIVTRKENYRPREELMLTAGV